MLVVIQLVVGTTGLCVIIKNIVELATSLRADGVPALMMVVYRFSLGIMSISYQLLVLLVCNLSCVGVEAQLYNNWTTVHWIYCQPSFQ